MTDLSRLMQEIDLADAELSYAQNGESTAIRRRELAEARAVALHKALVLIGEEKPTPETPSAAKPKRPYRRKKSGASEPSIPLEEAPGNSSPATAAPEPEHPERPDFLTRTRESAA